MSSFDERLERELAKLEAEKKKKKQLGRYEYLPSSHAAAKAPKLNLNLQGIASKLTDDDDDIAPVRTVTTKTTSTKKKEDESGLDFFQKGSFEDGFDWHDIPTAILGTAGDAGLGLVKGVAGIGEGIADVIGYAGAGVADLLGKDEYADQVRQRAKINMIEEATKGADEFLDKYSVLGRTSDAVMQGIGQVGAIMATGGLGAAAGLSGAGVTALTTGLMGVSGVGSGMSEAYQGGATDWEALKHGLNTGAADAVTELIFGGMGKAINAVGFSKGLSSADDMLAKLVGSKIKNKVAKNIVEFGIKSGAEGLEEVLSGIAQALSKHNTYLSEEDFGDILKDENLLEQFLVGSLTSGVMQSGLVPGTKNGSLKESIQTDRDFVTGLSQNEQAVIKKEVENRIAEAEKDGKKLTGKEKSAIEAQVEKDMEKGYISTDTIEEVLGGENYTNFKTEFDNFFESENFKSYKESLASEDAEIKRLENQLKELEGEPNTVGNSKQYDAIQSQIDELKNNPKSGGLKSILDQEAVRINAIKNQLRTEVSGLVKGDRLVESYNELTRKNEKFTADLNQYENENAKKTIQNLMDSGMGDNTRQFHEFADFLAKISADKGVTYTMTNDEHLAKTEHFQEGVRVNGFVNDNGDIVLNKSSDRALNTTVGHEITHVLESSKGLYSALSEAVKNFAIANEGLDGYNKRIQTAERLYKNRKNTTAEKEVVADLVGEYLFTDSEFIHRLSTENRNVFQKIYDEIKYLCKIVTAGSKEARELEKVKKAFEDAYRANVKGKAEGGTKFSVSETPLNQRLSGDDLLDAEDLIAEIEDVAEISPSGYVTVYHRTAEENAKKIMESGKMSAKEDGIFFSTQKEGAYSSDYGKGVVELKVPVEKLVLDDIFDTEAHLRIPLKNRNESLDISGYLPSHDAKYSLSDSDGKSEVVDGIAVATNVAEIMKSGEYSKPKDYMTRYSVSTTPAWAKNYLAQNKTTEAEAVVKAVKDFTDKMVQDDAVRGYVPMGEYKTTKMGPLRTNQEYIWTFDMDTSCPRTFQFLNFRDAIQRKAGRYLTYNESINLLELMRAYGQQIPCCYCYVENKRVLLSASYNNFFKFRNDVLTAATDEDAAKVMYGYSEKKGLPDASRKALERWRSDLSYNPSLTEVWTATNTARNSVLNFLDNEMASGNINAKTAESKLNKMVLDQFGIEDKGAIVEIEGFVKDWAYDTLANIPHIYNTDNNTDVSVVDEKALALNHEALAYSKSASSAKSVENYLPYTDQLKNVSEEDRKYIIGMGGIRKHSSNDFRMDYVQDYFLFYADLAAGKWTGHTYTKSADFTKIFACTGDRINMSVAFYEDADGTLRENTDEGAFWKDVKELRKAYKNVGAMAMVTSDNQLSYALNSDWIDMIIPFHASGLDKSVWYNLRMWNDYTSKQGERFYNADTMKQKLKDAGVEIPKGANASEVKSLFEDTFQVKHIYGKKGEVLKPHFFPGDTYVNGQLVPGHHNDVETYFRLCEEYGVHPRFYGIKVNDTNGNQIDVTEHPSYLKLIKETSRTDSEQEVIQFNFGNYDDYLKMTPFEYAMQRLQEEAKNGGFENTKEDPYGVVKEFTEEYLNQNRPLGYLTDRAKETREILLEMSRESAKQQASVLEESRQSLSEIGEQPRRYGDYNIFGKDIGLHDPLAEFAPVSEEVAKNSTQNSTQNSTVAENSTVSETESVAPYEDNWKDSFDSLTDDDAPPVRETAKGKKGVPDGQQAFTTEQAADEKLTRKQLHQNIVDKFKSQFKARGFDFDRVLKKAKNLSTFATVDNTPQRVMEKALGYKEGGILADLTVNRVAQNETAGIRWLNRYTDRKNGFLASISKQYHIKPGSKESAAAQMYAEGFYVDENNDIIQYGDRELAMDFPNAKVQQNIKGLARDPRIRQIYDQTLKAINASRARNAYPEIPRLDNYFLHFRAMEDTFSRLGLPFNPNDIRAKDLPTDLNGVTADLKPGQPYFASAMHRTGKRTSFDLLGGLEKYLTSAKNQIFHIDDIQNLRALRNYIADTYGQANGLEGLDALSEEEAQERIEKVYNSHLSTFAKFLNEEANILAGKTALIDRGLEGVIGRRGITFLDTVNKQVGSNMVGFNISSSLTNLLPVAQTFAKTNKFDFVKAFAQTAANKVGSLFGRTDGFTENSPVVIRRKGADRFYRTAWQKAADPGYALMGLVDDISTELIARTKYNELTRNGMDSRKAHIETDKWVSRLMGDRSLGQQPQLYNSRMLGLLTKFQLEVRNQLDSQFYDTIQETKASNEEIRNGLLRNAKTAAKVTSTFVQLAVVQHLFGKAFESVAGYNPAFDIIDVIIKAFGWDDDEEDEDTVLDNIEEAFLALLEDLPYTSTLTGGRIPIESALPVEQFVTGKDQYGNEKSRWETLGEVAPYYLMPGGYGQFKKTKAGLDMFRDEHPVAGSYTDSGNLRFPVEDTTQNRVQAAIFGQYANENARDYFDNERSPLKEKQIREYSALGISIQDYWDYRDTANELADIADSENATDRIILQSKYLNSVSDELSNLIAEERKISEDTTLTAKEKQNQISAIRQRFDELSREGYASYKNVTIEGDYANIGDRYYQWYTPEEGNPYWRKLTDDQVTKYLITKNADNPYYATNGRIHYRKDEDGEWVKISDKQLERQREVTNQLGITPAEYWKETEISFIPMSNGEYEYAYDNPENYAVAKVFGGYDTYKQYSTDLSSIKADKDEYGKSISGSRKEKVQDYIDSLDADYYTKLILFKSQYTSYDDENYEIVEYLNNRNDISYEEMVAILTKLDFTVHSDGRVTWD